MILALSACMLERTDNSYSVKGFKGFDKFEKVKYLNR